MRFYVYIYHCIKTFENIRIFIDIAIDIAIDFSRMPAAQPRTPARRNFWRHVSGRKTVGVTCLRYGELFGIFDELIFYFIRENKMEF